MIKKQWIFSHDKEENFIDGILKRRGITGKDEVKEYLSQTPRLTYDPFLLKNMKEASNRILEATRFKEKICLYGDYDADGVCSISLLIEVLRKFKGDFFYYIPSRFEEGYGLNKDAIKEIAKKGAKLLITVDCGSSSVEEVSYAKSLGMDVIITDHHNVGEDIPESIFVNPKQAGCDYPDKNLSGCGVAFKLAQALQRTEPETFKRSDLNKTLDLVTIATIGDIVPLLGENRTIVKYGLKSIEKNERLGLDALFKQVGVNSEGVKAQQLAFGIVPYINAAGRMAKAELAVELLITKDKEKAQILASELSNYNNLRRREQDRAYQEALEKIKEIHTDDKIIILELPDAHEGIAGIVAGKLKETYHLPTIVFTPSEGDILKGTGRSITGIDLYEALEPFQSMYENFGGHEGACGLSIKREYFQKFKKSLRADFKDLYEQDGDLFLAKVHIEGEVDVREELWRLAHSLEEMEPFGHKNQKPILALMKQRVTNPSFIGEKRNHVRFTASGLNCIMFNGSEVVSEFIADNHYVDMAGYLDINRWNGNENLQFVVRDIRHS